MHTLTVGKLRGLQQIATDQGFFAMTAMDHRASMQRMIQPSTPNLVSAQMLTAYKRDLTVALAPVSSAVLLDPIYGAAQVIASTDLPRSTGLLVGIEASGYTTEGGARITEFLEDWSLENAASSAPWILLSAGVDFDEFAIQVRIACTAGASGFLAGRAVWQD